MKVYTRTHLNNSPWFVAYNAAQQRCKPNKPYGKKGIKFLMTLEEFKFLWFRDNASKMHKPSIDRIDPKGHYIISNCRYLELTENISLSSTKTHCKQGHLLDNKNSIIRKEGDKECHLCALVRGRIYDKKRRERKSYERSITKF